MPTAKKYPFNDDQLTVREIAERLEITDDAVYKRLKKTDGKVTDKTFCDFHEGNVNHYVVLEDGSEISLPQFCRDNDIARHIAYYHYKKGARRASELLKKKHGVSQASKEESRKTQEG